MMCTESWPWATSPKIQQPRKHSRPQPEYHQKVVIKLGVATHRAPTPCSTEALGLLCKSHRPSAQGEH
eukprot:3090721-Pyramimonas_sp.AAC.1